ncbi:MAG: hypothetical protein GXO75_17240 [Calditrichaeota bacterium]|nr:hypothetical protein [Calditrichota bacterium]
MSLFISIGSLFAFPAAGRRSYAAQYRLLLAHYSLLRLAFFDLLCEGKWLILKYHSGVPP